MESRLKTLLRVASLLAFVALGAACSSAVKPKVDLDEGMIAGLTAFDYSEWSNVLKTYVNAEGRVDYKALKANRAGLDRFVALVGAVGPESRPDLFESREAKLAYYINAYNALVMFNVINRLPELRSVNDNATPFFRVTKFEVGGEELSLHALENEVIRPQFKEPRVHFALNCASVGCPKLPMVPFMPETLEAQLTEETKRFLNDERNVHVVADRVVLSQIFEWYKADFQPSPVRWINGVGLLETALPTSQNVTYRPYDWSLNSQN